MSQVAGTPGTIAALPAIQVLADGVYTLEISSSGAGDYTITEVLNARAMSPGLAAQTLDSAEMPLAGGRLPRRAGYGLLAGIDAQHTIDLGPTGQVAIARVSGSIDVDLVDVAGGGGTVDSQSLAIQELRYDLVAAGADRVTIKGTGVYVIVHTPADAFDALDHATVGTAQPISADALGALPGDIPPIANETEPNDDGVVGGSAADLDFAEDLRGDFVPIGGGQYRSEVNGEVSPPWDEDWDFYRFHARPGDSVTLELFGQPSGNGTLEDPTVRLFDRLGNQLAENDDIQNGVQRESKLIYSSFAYDGDYFAVADSWDYTEGSYLLRTTLTTTDLYTPPTQDVYAVSMAAWDELIIDLVLPDLDPVAGTPAQFALVLEDSAGQVVGGAGTTYRPHDAEVVTLKVQNLNGAFGEYVLLSSNWVSNLAALEIESKHGGPTPPVGTNLFDIGTSVTATVNSPVEIGSTQYVATGWTGTDDAPASGTGNHAGPFTLNQNSTLVWHWTTNVDVSVTVVGSGSVSGATGWLPLGTSVVHTATPAPHYDFAGWSGDASGTAATITSAVDRALDLTATFTLRNYTLDVASAQGTPSPGSGLVPALSTVNASVAVPPESGGIRYLSLGWTGTGDVPATGTGTSVPPFQVTQNSSITWLWNTQVLVTASAGPGGVIDTSGGWLDLGGSLAVHATADAHFDFAGWTGDTAGATINGSEILLPADAPRAVTATFTRKRYGLDVTSEPDLARPGHGHHEYDSETALTLSVSTNRFETNGTQYVFIGWTGTGAVPATGSTTSVGITMTEPSSIVWHWATKHYLDLGALSGGTVTPTSGFVVAGTQVQLTASPDPHFDFAGWVGDLGGAASNANPLTVTMDQPRTLTAQFIRKQYDLEIVSAHGGTTPAIGVHTFASETTQTVSLVSGAVTNGLTRHLALGWAGSGAVGDGTGSSTGPFVLTAPTTVTWLWNTNHFLGLDHNAGGSLDAASGWRDDGAVVTVTATPMPHHEFVGWSGDLAGATSNGTQLTVTMDQGRQITATFARLNYDLEIVSAHGSTTPAIGVHTLASETTQTVSLASGAVTNGLTRHLALGWAGTGAVGDGSGTSTGPFVLTAPTTVTWLWDTNHFLGLDHNAGGSLDATSDWRDDGAVVTVTAIPMPHQEFVGWSGDLAGTTVNGSQITVTMDRGRMITASFARLNYDLEIVSAHGGTTPAVGVHTFASETTQTVSLVSGAVTNGLTRHLALGWTGTGAVGDGSGTTTGPFVLTAPTTVTWLWDTNHFLGLDHNAGGSLDAASGWRDDGAVVTVTATPMPHHEFTGWSGDLAGTTVNGNQLTVAMDQGRQITASFARLNYDLEIVSAHGSTTPAVGVHTFASETTQTVSLASGVITNRLTRHLALGWTGTGAVGDGSGTTTGPFVLTAPTTVTWLWDTNHFLGLDHNAGGSLDATSGWRDDGAVVTVTATPMPHHEFTGWSGDLAGTTVNGNQLTVTMDQGRQITASFARLNYDLEIVSAHGSTTPATGLHTYPAETTVAVAVDADLITAGDTRFLATGWAGTGAFGDGTGTVTPATSLTAPSSATWLWQTQHLITVQSDPGIGVDQSTAWRVEGTTLIINATAQPHYRFAGWTGDLSGTTTNGPWISVPIDGPRTIRATGERRQYQLVVQSPYGSADPPVGTNLFEAESSLTATIGPAVVTNGLSRHTVTGFTGTGAAPSGTGNSTGPFSLTGDSSLTWNWQAEHYLDLTVDGPGSIDQRSGWRTPSTIIIARASDVPHHTVSWAGDIEGTSVNGNRITIPMDRGRAIQAVYSRVNYPLEVVSAYGSTIPGVGTQEVAAETILRVLVETPAVTNGLYRHNVVGWTGVGSVGDGVGAVTPLFELLGPTAVTWRWDTNVWIEATAGPGGSVSPVTGWHPLGGQVQIAPQPDVHFEFAGWQGDTTGGTVNPNGVLTLPADKPRAVQATFARRLYSLAIDSDHGSTSPAIGTHLYEAETPVSVDLQTSDIIEGTSRFRSMGWQGTGSFDMGGGDSTGPVPLTAPSSVRWLWETNFLLEVSAGIGGDVAQTTAWHRAGATAVLDAVPQAHFEFAGWQGDTDGGTITGTRISLPMDRARSVTATFTRTRYALTVTSPYGVPLPSGTQTFDAETIVSARMVSDTVIDGGARHRLRGWAGTGAIGDGTSADTGPFPLTSDTTIAWIWDTDYLLTADAETGGSVSGTTGWFTNGAITTLTATPDPEYLHAGWAGDLDGTTAVGNQLTVPMDRPRSITARFTQSPYELTVDSPYGTTTPTVGTHTYSSPLNLEVRVDQSPVAITNGTRAAVIGWNGFGSVASGLGDRTGVFSLDRPTGVTWIWQIQHWLQTDAGPGGITDTAPQWFSQGSDITVTAIPDPHYRFVAWTGDLGGANPASPSLTISMDRARTVSASFEPILHAVSITAAPGQSTPAAGSHDVPSGDPFTVTLDEAVVSSGGTRYLSTGFVGSGDFGSGNGLSAGPVTVTQPSSLTWTWNTQHLLQVAADVGGGVSTTGGWQSAGGALEVTATPSTGFDFVRWTGDTLGATIDGTRISLPADRPRSVVAEFSGRTYTVTVLAERGTATPPVGTTVVAHGTVLAPSMLETQIVQSLTRYVNPTFVASGPLTVVEDLQVEWTWDTEHWLEVLSTGSGGVDRATGWVAAGPLTVTATPAAYHRFVQWSDGDTTNPRTFSVNAPATITAQFEVLRTPAGVPHPWFVQHGIAIDDTADPDLDTVPNADEWQADTDPAEASDFPRVSDCVLDPGTGFAEWPSRAGILYDVEIADHPSGPYTPFAQSVPATPPTNRIDLPPPDDAVHFLRVISRRAP